MSKFYYNSAIPFGTDTRTPFFDDRELLILADVGWDTSTEPNKINKLELTPISKIASDNFEILDVFYCPNKGYFIVHIWENQNASTIKKAVRPGEIANSKILKAYQMDLFLFKVYDNPTRPIIKEPCELNGGIPDSKDGSIIIGT